MTFAAGRLEEAMLTSAAVARPFDQARALADSSPFRRAAAAVGDLFVGVAIVLCFPLVILGIGTPIALCLRFLLWIGGLVL